MPVTFGPEIKEGKVYRGKKRTEEDEEKRALAEVQSLLNSKHRRSCDCEAQIHDLLENCLNCGRLTCVAEGPGKCFFCGNLVVDQERRERLKKYIDLSYSFPTIDQNRSKATTSRVKIIDNQFDQFSIENQRHLREQEKQKLREDLQEIQDKRYQKKLVLNLDLNNMQAGVSAESVIDYTREMQNLQISRPAEQSSSHPTLIEVLDKQAKDAKHSADSKKADVRSRPINIAKSKNDTKSLNNKNKK